MAILDVKTSGGTYSSISAAAAAAAAGDIIEVYPGTYGQQVLNGITVGTPDAPLIIMARRGGVDPASNGGDVIITNAGGVGFNITNDTKHVEIIGFEITGCGGDGMFVASTCRYVNIKGIVSHNNFNGAALVQGINLGGSDCTVENCLTYRNGQHGVLNSGNRNRIMGLVTGANGARSNSSLTGDGLRVYGDDNHVEDIQAYDNRENGVTIAPIAGVRADRNLLHEILSIRNGANGVYVQDTSGSSGSNPKGTRVGRIMAQDNWKDTTNFVSGIANFKTDATTVFESL